MSRYILFPIFILYSITTLAQKRWYVNAAATGANNGSTWASAFSDLQSALALANAGDSIWVAKGSYLPTKSTDRSISFGIKSRVCVFGGFAGTETQAVQRDWKTNQTVLSGNIGKSNDSTDNSYNVVYMKHSEIGTVLDGFVIKSGYALASNGSNDFGRVFCGGGVYIDGEDWEAYPDIRNCTFMYNVAKNYGGGAFVNGVGDGSVAPVFQECEFNNNIALGAGGGISRIGGSWIERSGDFSHCKFIKNTAGKFGGGIHYLDSERIDKIELSDCYFRNNTSGNTGCAVYLGISRSNNGKLLIKNSVFESNENAIGSEIAHIMPSSFERSDSIVFDNVLFANNRALSNPIVMIDQLGYGKGCLILESLSMVNNKGFGMLTSSYTESNGTLFNNSYFKNNNGLLINISSGAKYLTFKNSIIQNNSNSGTTFTHFEKKFFIENVAIIGEGSKINTLIYSTIISDTFIIRNSTITGNIITNPKFGTFSSVAYTSIENSIITDIKDVLKNIAPPGDRYISHSYFDTLDCNVKPPNVNVTCGPGILTGINPLFVAPDSGDYRLQPCSPLVNTGTNTVVQPGSTDLDGKPRIIGGRVDIGAYETDAPALAAAPTITPACADRSNGSIAFEVASGCPPLQQQWTGPGGSSGSDTKNLRPGTYVITVTDSKGSSFSLSVRVPDSSTVALAALSQPVICGDTLGGSATARPSGGQPPYRFAWQGSPLGDSLRTDLAPGQYAVTATDERGCTATGSISVGRTGLLNSETQLKAITCNGAADGSLTVLPTNGKKPYKWLWDDGSGAPTRAPLGPGQYGLTLSDAFGCDIVWLLPLTEPERLREDMVSITKTSGATASDGKIALSIQGGTPPHIASWQHGATGLTIENLKAGEYTVTVTDKNGCTFSMTYMVGVTSSAGEPSVPAFSVAPNPTNGPLQLILQEPAPIAAPLRLFDTQGRLVRQWTLPQGAQRLGLQVGDLPTGVYQAVWLGRGGKIVVY